MFENFVSKLVQAVCELEKLGRGMHNSEVVDIIWQRVSNAELSQYLTAFKVQFQHQPHNYMEVLQDIASQVPYIGVDTFRNSSEVSVQGTDSGGAPDQVVYDRNGLLFHGKHTLRQNGLVIRSNLTGKISAELAMQLIVVAVALRPNTGVVPIKFNGTKRRVKS